MNCQMNFLLRDRMDKGAAADIRYVFSGLTDRLRTPGAATALEDLLARYAEPHRAYHNAHHIADMRQHALQLFTDGVNDRRTLGWAILYMMPCTIPRQQTMKKRVRPWRRKYYLHWEQNHIW